MLTKLYILLTPKFIERFSVLLITIIGYFSPVKNIAHMVLLFFFVDIIYGWLADKKKTGSKFKPKIIWQKTVPRILITMLLLMFAFMLDKETGQEFISTHKILGWFVGALLLWSIAENAYIVTKWKALTFIGRMIGHKIKKETGIEVKNNNK